MFQKVPGVFVASLWLLESTAISLFFFFNVFSFRFYQLLFFNREKSDTELCLWNLNAVYILLSSAKCSYLRHVTAGSTDWWRDVMALYPRRGLKVDAHLAANCKTTIRAGPLSLPASIHSCQLLLFFTITAQFSPIYTTAVRTTCPLRVGIY